MSHSISKCPDCEAKDARVAELDRDIAAKAHNLTYLNARAERAEAQLLAERSTAAYKDVRIERAEAALTAANADLITVQNALASQHEFHKMTIENCDRLRDDWAAAVVRAEQAEAERDALLYNAESKYCAGMSAGFELGRNDNRAELSRIITQRWKEIADAKARAAPAPSPAEREEEKS